MYYYLLVLLYNLFYEFLLLLNIYYYAITIIY